MHTASYDLCQAVSFEGKKPNCSSHCDWGLLMQHDLAQPCSLLYPQTLAQLLAQNNAYDIIPITFFLAVKRASKTRQML